MKCHECGKEMRLLRGYAVTDPNVGAIKTDGEYWECTDPNCDCRLVPAATAQKVDDIREDRIGKMLWSIASNPREFAEKFILAKDVARILGVTRQAVEKSVYAKAMTYSIIIGNVRYWLKESVERYKKTGNGKFPLAKAEETGQDIRLREADFGKPDTSWLTVVISQKQTNGQTINISTISPQKAGEACKGKKNENQGIVQEILTQPANKPVFIDLFNFSRDPENTILNISACYRFDGTFENDRNAVRFVEYARLAITTEHARRTVDALTRLLDYYPQKPEPPKEEKTRAKENISLS